MDNVHYSMLQLSMSSSHAQSLFGGDAVTEAGRQGRCLQLSYKAGTECVHRVTGERLESEPCYSFERLLSCACQM